MIEGENPKREYEIALVIGHLDILAVSLAISLSNGESDLICRSVKEKVNLAQKRVIKECKSRGMPIDKIFDGEGVLRVTKKEIDYLLEHISSLDKLYVDTPENATTIEALSAMRKELMAALRKSD